MMKASLHGVLGSGNVAPGRGQWVQFLSSLQNGCTDFPHFSPKMSPLGHRGGRRIPGGAWSPVHSGGDVARSPGKAQEMPQEWDGQEAGC